MAGNFAGVLAFWESLELAWQRAATVQPVVSRSFDLAGYGLHLLLAGAELDSVLLPALSHLPVGEDVPDGLTVRVWDEATTGVPLPPAGWEWPVAEAPGSVVRIWEDDFSIILSEGGQVLTMYDAGSRTAWVWIQQSHRLPGYVRAAPLLRVFKLWIKQVDIKILHAGCVGSPGGVVLLVGSGGSGKSTTSLLCALGGMSYLGDDYILVRFGDAPQAFSLYNSGKLHGYHLALFPELEKRVSDLPADLVDKPVIYLGDHFPDRLLSAAPVKAIVVPKVTGLPEVSVREISDFETIKALAPSTLLQLYPDGGSPMVEMSAMVRALPCFQLELGSDTAAIAPTLRTLVESLG